MSLYYHIYMNTSSVKDTPAIDPVEERTALEQRVLELEIEQRELENKRIWLEYMLASVQGQLSNSASASDTGSHPGHHKSKRPRL